MSTYTKYKRIEKPLALERYNIDIVNKNNDIIDSELHKLELKNESQDNLLATKEALNTEVSRATTKENAIESSLSDEISRSQSAEFEITNNLENEVNRAITVETTIRKSLSDHILNEQNPHNVTKAQIGLGNVDNTSDMDKPVSTAQQNALDTALSTHNTSDSSHSDMRLLISGLTTRLNALADSDDTTLDQLSEIVDYIKNNKSLIDGITTSKVNVSDIIDDLTSSATGKPLSAKQGMILKGLITDLTSLVGDKVDKVSGKGLSTNDYTTEEKTKLGGIAVGAEVNVQADWNETDSTSDAFIKNKPDINSITNNAIDDITPASIGAVAKAGDTMTGMLQIKTNGSGPNNPKLMTLDENGTHTYVGSDCVETVTPEGAVGILKLNPEGASGAGEVQVGSPLRIQSGMNVNMALDNHPEDDYQFFVVFNGYTDDGTGGNVGYKNAGQVRVGKASRLVDAVNGSEISATVNSLGYKVRAAAFSGQQIIPALSLQLAGEYGVPLADLFNRAAIEIREAGMAGNTGDNSPNYAPRIGFHWGNVAGGSIALLANGNFAIYKQNGSDIGYIHCTASHAEFDNKYGYAIGDEIYNLKNSVSNGKAQVASAITAKGVATAADASFATMAANIGSISGLKYDRILHGQGVKSLSLVAGSLSSSVIEVDLNIWVVGANARNHQNCILSGSLTDTLLFNFTTISTGTGAIYVGWAHAYYRVYTDGTFSVTIAGSGTVANYVTLCASCAVLYK